MKRRSRIRVNQQNDHFINEMEGLFDLGLKEPALTMARKLLETRPLSLNGFQSAARIVMCVADNLEELVPLVENAYASLSKRNKRTASDSMLGFYVSLEDWTSANRFIRARPQDAHESMFAMWTLLNLKRLHEAKKVFRQCQRGLQILQELRRQGPELAFPFQEAMLLEAMGNYCAITRQFADAEFYWRECAALEPFLFNSLTDLVRLQAARGRFHVKVGRAKIVESKQSLGDETALSLPGNSESIVSTTEKELNEYEESLKTILPDERRWEFGL